MDNEFGLIDIVDDSSVDYPEEERFVDYEEFYEPEDEGTPDTDEDDDKIDSSGAAGEFELIDSTPDPTSNSDTEPNRSDEISEDEYADFAGTDDDIPDEETVLEDNILEVPTLVNVKKGDICIVQDVGGEPVVIGVIGGGDSMASDIAEAWKKANEAYQESVAAGNQLIETTKKAEQAALDAATAKEAVNGITQYTWNDAEGTHVSTKQNSTDNAANILINAAGVDINTTGTDKPVASFTKDGVILREIQEKVVDGSGETQYINAPIASFTKNGMIVGSSDDAIGSLTKDGLLVGSGANKKLAATAEGVVIYDSNGNAASTFNDNGVQLAIAGTPVANFGPSSIVLGGGNTTSITMAGNAVLNVSKLNIGPVYDPITSKDDLKGPKGDKGDKGDEGKPKYTWIKYADDSKGTGISNDPTGKKYIGLAYNKETPTESNNPSDYTWSKITGEQGVKGDKGEDGKPTFTWIKYSDYENGYDPYDVPNKNTKYIGIATNKDTKIESSNPDDYVWSKFKGEPGEAPTISANGKWIIEGVETDFIAIGDDGNPPKIGDDGYWYEWNADIKAYQNTYIKAQGPQGIKGDKGEKGDTGIDVTSQYAVYDKNYGLYLTKTPNSYGSYHTLITDSGIFIKNGSYVIGSFTGYSNGLTTIKLGKARITENDNLLALGLENGASLYFSSDGTLYVGKSTSTTSNLNSGSINCNGITTNSSINCGSSVRASTNVSADGDIIANYGAGMGIGLRYDSSKWGVYSWGTSSATSNKWLIYRSAGGTVTCGSSSKQCKENIVPVSDEEAKKLLDIGTYTFDYKEEACPVDNNGNVYTEGRKGWIGVLAEDVYDVIPRAVCNTEGIDIAATIAKGGDTSSLGIDYSTFVPYLIKLCQLQQNQIDELEAKNKEFEDRLAALEAKLGGTE